MGGWERGDVRSEQMLPISGLALAAMAAHERHTMGVPEPARRKAPHGERNPNYTRQWSPDPALIPYRGRTTAILRRYARLAVQQGRLPSIVGRDFFRSRVSSWQVHTFEDDIIFTFDVERCLQQLDPLCQAVLARVVLEEYTPDDAAFLLHVGRTTVFRKLGEALDQLSELMLRRRLMRPFPGDERFASAPSPQAERELSRGK